MQKAVEEACVAVASGDGGPFGAVIVKDGKIFATGHNMVKFFLYIFFSIYSSGLKFLF